MQGGTEVSSYHVDNVVDMLKIWSPLYYTRSSDHHKLGSQATICTDA